MGAKNKYEKILARKNVILVDAPRRVSKSYSYKQAMDLVRALRRAGNYQLGNSYLEQIVAQAGDVPEPGAYLLQIYTDDMRLEDGRKLAADLRDKFPVDSFVMRSRVRFLQMAGELDEAEELILHAVQIYPNNAKNLGMLAELYQQRGDKARALNYYDRALAIEPNCGALFGKARLMGAKSTPEFIAQIYSAIESKKFSGVQLASLHFALAFIYLDTDTDLHFRHLNEANRTVAARRGYDLALRKKEVENILYRFRKPAIDALHGVIESDYKPIFIIGMPRSGTTLLEQVIGAHPQCQPIGESGAFANAIVTADKLGCPPLDASSPQAIDACRKYFVRVADNFKNNRLVAATGGKSPVDKSLHDYMYLGLIMLAMPNARIIYADRHPLAIVYSCYQQNFSSGNTYSFNLEWIAEEYKLFKKLMAHWMTVFPGKILTVHYEKLVRDKQNEVERALKFCDLEWDAACLEHEKSVGLITTASVNQVRQPVYQSSAEKWKKVEHYLEPAKRLLGEWLDYPY